MRLSKDYNTSFSDIDDANGDDDNNFDASTSGGSYIGDTTFGASGNRLLEPPPEPPAAVGELISTEELKRQVQNEVRSALLPLKTALAEVEL
jgi:hypothetical protein